MRGSRSLNFKFENPAPLVGQRLVLRLAQGWRLSGLPKASGNGIFLVEMRRARMEEGEYFKNLDQNVGPSKQGNWYEQDLHTSHVHFSSMSFAAASSASSFAAARCA
jgi:hypothetical protein